MQDEDKFTPGATGWKARDGYAAELETCEFLYGLVRLIKPASVVEGGCGDTTRHIYKALEDNAADGRVGKLTSYETNQEYAKPLQDEGYPVWVGSCVNHIGIPDMVFLDTDLSERLNETEYWLEQNVLLVIHDAHRTDLIGELPRDGITLDNPRGLWMRNKKPHRFKR